MSQSLQLREQAERCRRLARNCTDDSVRDSLFGLADTRRASALEGQETAIRNTGSHDQGAN
jgi:hypothetical protein